MAKGPQPIGGVKPREGEFQDTVTSHIKWPWETEGGEH